MSSQAFAKWSDEQCKLLEPLWELSRARRDSHHIAYRHYNKCHTVVNLPPILLGAILSTISLKPESVPTGISATLAVFITGLSTVNTFFEFSKSREGHRQCYRSFNAIVRDIELNIIRGREDPRRSFVDFMESVNEQFSHVVESAPPLSKTARKHLNNYRNTRQSPFDLLLKGDIKATGYDSSMDENTPSEVVVDDAAGVVMEVSSDIIIGDPDNGIELAQRQVSPAINNEHLESVPREEVQILNNPFSGSNALEEFNKEVSNMEEKTGGHKI
jgi:hypothetical protein